MSRTVYYTAASLDGYLADERNSLEWLFGVENADPPYYVGFMDSIGCLVEGSTTYEWVLEHGEADYYGARCPTFVFTTRRLPRPDGVDLRFVSGAVRDVYPELVRAAAGRDIWVVGGGDLAGQFLDADLLDELQISVAPVTLAAGAPLLPRQVPSSRLRLRTVEQQGQFAHLVYDVVKRDAEGGLRPPLAREDARSPR